MNTILFRLVCISILVIIILSNASAHSLRITGHKMKIHLSDSCTYLSQADAELIMGKPVVLTETTNAEFGEVYKQRCIYTAASTDDQKEIKEILHVGVDEYKDIPSAQKVFSETVSDNEKDAELKALQLGDETFLQSTSGVFHLK